MNASIGVRIRVEGNVLLMEEVGGKRTTVLSSCRFEDNSINVRFYSV